MSYDDDLFGLHDFNGDGKISLYEESLSYSIYEEIFDEESATIGGYASSRAYKPGLSTIPREPVSKENYRRIKRELITSVVLTAFVDAFFSVFPVLIMIAVISAQSENDISAWPVTLIFCGGALVLLWKIWRGFVLSVRETRSEIKSAQEEFSRLVSTDELKNNIKTQ